MPVLRMTSAIRTCRRHTDRGRCGIVPVTRTALLQSINPTCRRAKSVSRRKPRRTSAHVRAGVSYPYPPHDRVAFASSDLLLPHTRRLTLRRAFPAGAAFPSGRWTGVPRSAAGVRRGRCLRSAGRSMVHDAARERRHAPLRCLLAHASQPLWLVRGDDRSRRFTSVHPPDSRALTRMRCPGGDASHD